LALAVIATYTLALEKIVANEIVHIGALNCLKSCHSEVHSTLHFNSNFQNTRKDEKDKENRL
jgi:hypothetical protein